MQDRNQIPSSHLGHILRNCLSKKKSKTAILIFNRNRGTGGVTVLSAIPLVLKACASISVLAYGKALHCEIVKSGFECSLMVGTSLVDMYGKCQDIVSSRKVFDYMPDRNVITWNAMIGGYMRNGDAKSASFLFRTMAEKTSATWNEMIDGYTKNGDTEMARRVFESMPVSLKNVVTWTVMVDGYVSNGDMEAAMEVFEGMRERNFYVWSVLISGKALDAFMRMQREGFEPDQVTIASVLSACAQSGMLDFGKEVHELILRKGIELNHFILNGLVDMYAKCGDLRKARLIFEDISIKRCATWNTLISGFAIHGQCREAIEFFSKMEKSGVKPDIVTFLSLLSACAHGGFVEEGLEAFSKMERYGLKANVKHYGSLVDLFGRAGKLLEAFNLVKEMPIEPNDTIFGALLGACRTQNDTVMVEKVLELVKAMNIGHGSHYDAHYVLLSNIYAASERWEKAEGMRVAFSGKGFEKEPGCSALMF
ncbi:hypothetical protein ACJIZ3_024662 [Penstemon smallii]|uniref:Pentatricopeptide repeat-containing protein n=1 Tax=Penstemon smallii TaxID=265156 RepID=A0ABD3TTU0_9LAMI